MWRFAACLNSITLRTDCMGHRTSAGDEGSARILIPTLMDDPHARPCMPVLDQLKSSVECEFRAGSALQKYVHRSATYKMRSGFSGTDFDILAKRKRRRSSWRRRRPRRGPASRRAPRRCARRAAATPRRTRSRRARELVGQRRDPACTARHAGRVRAASEDVRAVRVARPRRSRRLQLGDAGSRGRRTRSSSPGWPAAAAPPWCPGRCRAERDLRSGRAATASTQACLGGAAISSGPPGACQIVPREV